MSAWRNLRLVAAALAAAGTVSGCVVVVDGEHGEDDEWDVRWAGGQEVQHRSPEQRDELARDVSTRIASTPALSSEDITVSAREGVVTLHGRVGSVATLEEAMGVAAATPGVVRVVSRLSVVSEVN